MFINDIINALDEYIEIEKEKERRERDREREREKTFKHIFKISDKFEVTKSG